MGLALIGVGLWLLVVAFLGLVTVVAGAEEREPDMALSGLGVVLVSLAAAVAAFMASADYA